MVRMVEQWSSSGNIDNGTLEWQNKKAVWWSNGAALVISARTGLFVLT